MEDHATQSLLEAADDLARSRLSDARYEHTLRVAGTAERLAKAHGLAPEKARLAALIHDSAREVAKDEYLRLAAGWNLPVGEPERESPKLLHGPIAAELARRKLGINDEGVLDAVREHTVGADGMSELSLVLYLADKIEPVRDYPSVERIRKMSEADLHEAAAEALGRSIAHNEERGKPIHPSSREALAWLERRKYRE